MVGRLLLAQRKSWQQNEVTVARMLFREEPGDFIDCIDSNHNLFGLKLTDKKTRGRDRVIEIDTKIPLSTENHRD